MRFLKTLIWVTIVVGLVVFATNNWAPVSVSLWGGLRLDTKLPALVIVAFLLGFLPLYILHRTQIWRMKRRILTLEGNQRTLAAPPPPASPPAAYKAVDPI
jgi:lipopolysaccharide assembly protein A